MRCSLLSVCVLGLIGATAQAGGPLLTPIARSMFLTQAAQPQPPARLPLPIITYGLHGDLAPTRPKPPAVAPAEEGDEAPDGEWVDLPPEDGVGISRAGFSRNGITRAGMVDIGAGRHGFSQIGLDPARSRIGLSRVGRTRNGITRVGYTGEFAIRRVFVEREAAPVERQLPPVTE